MCVCVCVFVYVFNIITHTCMMIKVYANCFYSGLIVTHSKIIVKMYGVICHIAFHYN